MTELRSSFNRAETFAHAASRAESTGRRSREILKAIERLAKSGRTVAVDQSHQQAAYDTAAQLSVLQTDVRHRLGRLDLMLKELNTVGQILRLVAGPATGLPSGIAGDGRVVSLSHKRLRRRGADRLIADSAARLQRLCDEIDLLHQMAETGFRALSDIIHR